MMIENKNTFRVSASNSAIAHTSVPTMRWGCPTMKQITVSSKNCNAMSKMAAAQSNPP